MLAEVEGELTLLTELARRVVAEVEAIVARARARGTTREVRFEREDLLDLRDALGAALETEAPLAALVARALEAHAELLWTTWTPLSRLPSSAPSLSRMRSAAPSSSQPDFAAHVVASGGVVFGVMADVGGESTDPVVFLAAKLADYGYVLADGGEIVDVDGVGTGWAWWSAPAEAYVDRPWHSDRSPCPFLGACLGYVGVRALWGSPDDEENLWIALARTTRGIIARIDDDRALQTVTLQRRALSSVWDRHGIDDGDALLTRDPGLYFDDVVARIRAAAATVGAKVYTFETCHNPIRRAEWDEQGVPIEETPAERRRWEAVEVELWLRDVCVTEPPGFGPLPSQRR